MNAFIAETFAVGNFTSANIHQVMIVEEMGGVTYAVQFNTPTKETLEQFQQQELVLLQKQMQQQFSGKYVFFHTELKVVTQFQP
jgi:Holliday junction resolvasome RuvABC DNA-binding subunit